jgi:hypothetical protein
MSKLRWAKFFWADWSNDTALNLCSIPARGLWMSLLCIAAQGDPYGAVNIKGRPLTEAELRDLCKMKNGPHAARDFRRWLDELERHGVFVWADIVPVDSPDAHPSRTIVSPRMHHDGTIAKVRSNASKHRWKTADNRQSSADLHMQKPSNGPDLHMQSPTFASIESESESEEDPPRPPRKAGGGAAGCLIVRDGRKGSPRANGTNPRAFDPPRPARVRNGFLQTIINDMELKCDDGPSPGGAEVVPIPRRPVSG